MTSRRCAPAGAVLLLATSAGTAPPAHAANAALVTARGYLVSFVAADGQANDLEITRWSTAEYVWTYRFDDVVPLRIGGDAGDRGCTRPDADDPTVVQCVTTESPQDGGPALQIRLGDGADVAVVAAYTDAVHDIHDAFVDAGPGDDVVVVRAIGGRVRGGPGDDLLVGGPWRDRLEGGDGADRLLGRGGGDTLRGGPGPDVLYGDGDADALFGGPGDDALHGGPGADTLDGGAGRDRWWQD